ncbi:DegT/DnrJ/EryC1/StrS family aminotransferase [Halococcus saccharolyticus]|uniref:Glutamine--scyllo-inositol transaminase n=1 Tax=Halococcus saccharolyticus DSM 5350 TaxID=1227455 RepID=M0MLN2_9EURY|nr:DegT/DnrJ/EryC1/StrS family aminotransferase [Halococcus saccharolyticus]EMA45360.1 Glutamine--scyllo-inositol transaminase [Halococcus saccharolyticus DSM 5350]
MIPIADPELGEREKERVGEIIESGQLADGPEVRGFEEEFAAFCGASHGVATANGTTALHTALEALDIGPGDTVVTPSFSFIASANAVRFTGAEPVFADIDPNTYNLDPDAVESVVAERDVDAILAVHLFGLPADMERLGTIAEAHDLHLIEDAAQAHGAAIDGERVGTFGDAACFSFYPTKNLTTGEGGMVLTDDEDVAARAARFVNHGRSAARFGDDTSGSYDHATVGHNFRMSSVLAAIGRVQIDHRLRESNEQRRENAARLTEGLADVEGIETPVEPDGRRHVYHQYTIRTDDRDALRAHLDDEGIGTGIYYPTPIHEQPAYDEVTCDVPVTERAAEEVLSLPVHPNLSASDLETIMTAVRRFEMGGHPS